MRNNFCRKGLLATSSTAVNILAIHSNTTVNNVVIYNNCMYIPWQIKIVGMFFMQVESCNACWTGTHILVITPTGKVDFPVSQV